VKDDPSYSNLVGQPGSTAHELFDDLVKEEKEILEKYKPPFKSLIKSKGIKFPHDVEFAVFDTRLSQHAEYGSLGPRARVILHEYYLHKVRQKEQEKAKKSAKALKHLEKFLRGVVNVNRSCDYADYRAQVERQSEFASLSEDLKHKAFDEVLGHLRDQSAAKRRKRSRSRVRVSSSAESGELKRHPSKDKNGVKNNGGGHESQEEGQIPTQTEEAKASRSESRRSDNSQQRRKHR